MDCRQCSEELTAFIDGELVGGSAEQMKLHLDKCPPCRAEMRELQNSAAFVEMNSRELEPIPEIWNNLRSRIAEMPTPEGSHGFFRFLVMNRWTAAAATLAATAVLALGLWGYLQGQKSSAEFEAYMNDYIQTRMTDEAIHSTKIAEAERNPWRADLAESAFPRNPFAQDRPAAIENLFQTEER